MKNKPKQIAMGVQAASRKIMRLWKRLIVKRKYGRLTLALCEYVTEIIVSRAADYRNDIWYNERLAATAQFFALLLTGDGLRFIRTFDDEVEAISRSRKMSALMCSATEHWQKFTEKTNQWREKYYSPKLLTRRLP